MEYKFNRYKIYDREDRAMKKLAALLLIAVLFTLSAAFAACGRTHSVEHELGTNPAADAVFPRLRRVLRQNTFVARV